MRSALIVSCLLLLAACGASNGTVDAPIASPRSAVGAGGTQTYAIKFGRKGAVGERMHVILDKDEDMTIKVKRGDGPPQQTEHKVTKRHLDAVQTLLALDAQGRESHLRYQVKELVLNGEPLGIHDIDLTRGARKEDAVLIADGKPMEATLRTELGDLLKLRVGGGSDDDVFGTDAPQPIGAHWPIRQEQTLAALKEDGTIASRAKGDVWLEGVTTVDDAECTHVKATLELDGIQLPDAPAGAQVEESRLTAQMEAALPIDQRVERATDRMKMHMTFRMRVPQSGADDLTILVTAENTNTSHLTALPARR